MKLKDLRESMPCDIPLEEGVFSLIKQGWTDLKAHVKNSIDSSRAATAAAARPKPSVRDTLPTAVNDTSENREAWAAFIDVTQYFKEYIAKNVTQPTKAFVWDIQYDPAKGKIIIVTNPSPKSWASLVLVGAIPKPGKKSPLKKIGSDIKEHQKAVDEVLKSAENMVAVATSTGTGNVTDDDVEQVKQWHLAATAVLDAMKHVNDSILPAGWTSSFKLGLKGELVVEIMVDKTAKEVLKDAGVGNKRPSTSGFFAAPSASTPRSARTAAPSTPAVSGEAIGKDRAEEVVKGFSSYELNKKDELINIISQFKNWSGADLSEKPKVQDALESLSKITVSGWDLTDKKLRENVEKLVWWMSQIGAVQDCINVIAVYLHCDSDNIKEIVEAVEKLPSIGGGTKIHFTAATPAAPASAAAAASAAPATPAPTHTTSSTILPLPPPPPGPPPPPLRPTSVATSAPALNPDIPIVTEPPNMRTSEIRIPNDRDYELGENVAREIVENSEGRINKSFIPIISQFSFYDAPSKLLQPVVDEIVKSFGKRRVTRGNNTFLANTDPEIMRNIEFVARAICSVPGATKETRDNFFSRLLPRDLAMIAEKISKLEIQSFGMALGGERAKELLRQFEGMRNYVTDAAYYYLAFLQNKSLRPNPEESSNIDKALRLIGAMQFEDGKLVEDNSQFMDLTEKCMNAFSWSVDKLSPNPKPGLYLTFIRNVLGARVENFQMLLREIKKLDES